MKKILITGKDSFVGTSFEKWLNKVEDQYKVDTIDMRDENWKKHDFSEYDSVLHVAGIAHVSTDPKMEELYYKVNRDLTIEVAKKAKLEGVSQFVFMSSIIVYGDATKKKTVITRETVPTPKNFYGKSKLEAEQGITTLQDDKFNVVVIRPPMIYGKGSKGNYNRLAKFAKKYPIFPKVKNERSMIYIDNLSEFIRLMIENNEQGLFFPQNKEYVCTSEMVKLIAKANGRKVRLTRLFNPCLWLLGVFSGVINKVFGNLVYDKEISDFSVKYSNISFKKSIEEIEML